MPPDPADLDGLDAYDRRLVADTDASRPAYAPPDPTDGAIPFTQPGED